MREILFRGKRFMDGEWVDGNLFVDEKKDKHEILIGYVNYRVGWEIDPKTVGQFTGLTDKNGKKIFEGDIIECWSEGVKAKGTVQQNRGGLWIIYPAWQKRIMWGLCPSDDGSTDVEIIGNIYDNPELIEELR